jgi:hypothetical protein
MANISSNFLGRKEKEAIISLGEAVEVYKKTNRDRVIIFIAAVNPSIIRIEGLTGVLNINWKEITNNPMIRSGRILEIIFCFDRLRYKSKISIRKNPMGIAGFLLKATTVVIRNKKNSFNRFLKRLLFMF